MTASGIAGIINYNINGLGGGDKIVVKYVATTFTVRIRGGEGDDRITGISDRKIAAVGDEGDDVIRLSARGSVSAFGTPGSDKLTLDSVFDFGVAVLLQNLPSTEPDGKKDFLDCKNVLKSVAYISPRMGTLPSTVIS
jgi:hypothetical protein